MSFMKKQNLIQFDFHSSVKLAPKEKTKIINHLGLAALVLDKLFQEKGFVHSSWTKKHQNIRLSLLLCGEAKIKKLNSDYRAKNKVTDVLSFPSYESLRKSASKGDSIFDHELFLGDLAICHQKTIKQAHEFNISYIDEFIHLLIHGMIHLVGYDHEVSTKEEALMQKWENEAINYFSKIKKKGP